MSKILIIEDEVAIADLEKDYLELSDFKVDICNTGDEGLKTALAGDYDLIILDLMLPGMDGFEVCKKIREEKNIPILMVSAKKDDIDKIRGLGLGADDYMTKPFSPSELMRDWWEPTRSSRMISWRSVVSVLIRLQDVSMWTVWRRRLRPRNSIC